MTTDDEMTCAECGGGPVGTFTIDTVTPDSVATEGKWAGCYACLLFHILTEE